MKLKHLLLLIIGIALYSCAEYKGNTTDVFDKVYNEDNLKNQFFTFDATIDNIVEGKQGTKILITKNTFVNEDGSVYKGEVDLEIKEVFTAIDMVMGNMTTTSNGKTLQTGGMIYLNATGDNGPLVIATDKEIEMMVPTDSVMTNMSLFKGEKDSSGINWVQPEAIPDQPTFGRTDSIGNDEDFAMRFEKSHNLRYSIEGFDYPKDYPTEVSSQVSRFAWAGAGLKIKKDTSYKYKGYTVHLYKQDTLFTYSQVFEVKKGSNTGIEDRNLSYIISIKKLGWANIDRFLMDPRTEELDLNIIVVNHKEFELVYTTMAIKTMYLSGYQKLDDSYCFSHGDYETTKLPVGEKATIIATASKEDITYFGFKTINLAKKQTINIDLKPTTKEKLEAALREEI